MSKEILGSIYYDASEQFGVGYMPKLCKTLKATKNSVAIIEKEIKPLRIGGLYDTDTKHQAGSVWDKNRIAPTVDTMQGGQREPLILTENIIIGGEQKHQAIKKDGVCTCLTSSMGTGGGYIPMVVNEIKVLGQIDGTFESSNRVYDKNGLAPTLKTSAVASQQCIVKETNCKCISTKGKENEVASTILSGYERTNMTGFNADNAVLEKVKIKQATSQGYIECEVGGVADLSFPDSKTRRGRVQENGQVSPTLMSGEQDICRIEKEERFFKQALNVLENENCEVGDTIDSFNGKVNKSGVSPTITTRPEGFKTAILPVVQSYRIRKLTPLECWRLMDFSDEDFYKAEEVNSNTQLYKEAGNSIVRNVLVAIFGQMILGKENVYKEVI